MTITNNLKGHQGSKAVRLGPLRLVSLTMILLLNWVEARAVTPHDSDFDDPIHQAEQTEENARQTAKENAELRKKAEAAEQELARQRLENARPKTDTAAEQRALQLEKQVIEAKRKADEEKVEKQHLEKQLAKEKLKTEQAEAEQRRLEAKLEQSRKTVNTPRSEPVTSPSDKGTRTTASSAIGSTIKDCNDCPELVVIPSGEFTMGSPDSEVGRNTDEGPQHTVRIGYRLAVGKYEVTFAEWDACVAEGGCTLKPDDKGWGRGKRPVINVSWNDIKEQYLPWLNHKAGLSNAPDNLQYRLPSEAEWEYAARAGTSTPFSFGDSITETEDDLANYYPHHSETIAVGSYAPNDWGLYDMHGNVSEWVEDCYEDNYNGAPDDGRPVQEAHSYRLMARGGSFTHAAKDARSASRRMEFSNSSFFKGFRLARMLQ